MKKYNAAVIGLGNIGMMYEFDSKRSHPSSHTFAFEMSDKYELICGIDTDDRKEVVFKESFPKSKYYKSIDEALESGDLEGADVISLCTPPNTHYNILQRLISLNIGKIIFCEKPLACNIEEAKAIMTLVEGAKDQIIVPDISRRWNRDLKCVVDYLHETNERILEKINIRYTRGVYNTGTHIFDLLVMLTGSRIKEVQCLSETDTTVLPERTFSFFFTQENGITGYAEAINDDRYYLFDIDLYLNDGKVEIKNSADDLLFYGTCKHHLFENFNELTETRRINGCLSRPFFLYALSNIVGVMEGNESPACTLEDAIYPMYVAEALERSFNGGGKKEIVKYG